MTIETLKQDKMKNEKLNYLNEKLNFLFDCLNSCHKSMEDYYYNEIKKYQLLIADTKNN